MERSKEGNCTTINKILIVVLGFNDWLAHRTSSTLEAGSNSITPGNRFPKV